MRGRRTDQSTTEFGGRPVPKSGGIQPRRLRASEYGPNSPDLGHEMTASEKLSQIYGTGLTDEERDPRPHQSPADGDTKLFFLGQDPDVDQTAQ